MRVLARTIALLSSVLVSAGLLLGSESPVPLIYSPVTPASIAPGTASVTLMVDGLGFVPGAVVNWNSSPLPTTFISSSQLTAVVAGDLLTEPSTGVITVANVGLTISSNPVPVEVRNGSNRLGFGQTSFAAGVSGPFYPMLIDLNKDGNLDVVALDGFVNPLASALLVSLGNGDGTFGPSTSYGLTGLAEGVIAADYNGDGNIDLAVGEVGTPGLTLFLGRGDGTFDSQVIPEVPSGTVFSVAADLNGDGKVDLALAQFYPVSQLTILLGNGDGTFQPPISYPLGGTQSVSAAVVGDFDRDGKLDVAVSLSADNDIAVLRGNGDGTFQSPAYYPAAASPVYLVAADVNGDGLLDLLAQGKGAFSVLLGAADGTFAPRADFPIIDDNTLGLALADLNGDGLLDVAIPNNTGDNTTAIYLGRGDGSFRNPTFWAAAEALGISAGDVNRDGLVDIVVASLRGDNTIRVLHQSSIVASNSLLNFGRVKAGTQLSMNVTLTNTGDLAAQIGNFTLGGSSRTGFRGKSRCSGTLEVGQSCSAQFTFAPGERTGEARAIANFNDSETLGVRSIILLGFATK